MPAELKEPYGQVLEPLTTLSIIAGRTSRLRLGTSIVVLPQRNPILVAKQATALDVYSGGRVILGFGAGWAEKEFGYLNADFKRRGRVFDESVRLMRALWTQEVVDFEGGFFRVKGALFLPKPVGGSIPVWIGGNGRTAVSRAIRVGDGWHPTGVGIGAFTAGVERVRMKGKGLTFSIRMTTDVRKKRDPVVLPNGETRTVASGSAAEIRRTIEDYEKAGLEYYCASILHPSAAEIERDLKRFAADVVRSYGNGS